MADRNPDPYIGRQLEGRYEILNLLGRGGMGSVYRAIDSNLRREVAVKLLREDFASRPDLRQRFLQEAELAAQMEHPGIVPVYHVNGDGNLLYIVMELVPGGNLADLMAGMRQKRKWITPDEALQIVRQIAIALQYAHGRNILHRDIKPANIMLRNRASAGLDYQPVVTDLGLAKVIDQNASMQPLMGTPSYMSPEQVLAQDLDGRSDIYSLGLLLYELLVGRLPFQITSFPEALKYHVHEPIRSPRSLRPDLPQSVEVVVLRAVAQNLDERFPTAAEFAASIDALGSVGLSSPPPQAQSTVGLVTEWQTSIIDQPDRPVLPSVVQVSQIQGPSLQVRQPDGQFLTIGLKPKMTIGREQGNDLVLEDTQVSRNHALLRRQGSEYTITDLKSTNGTFLNRQKLAAERPFPLTQSDDLRIGNHRLRLLLGQDEVIDGLAFRALLMESSVGGVAGETVEIPLQVTNQQERPVNIDVSVVGIDNNWVRPFRPVEIPGGQKKRIALTLALPSDSAAGGNRFNLLLRAVDRISGYEQTLETQLHVAAPGSTIPTGPPPPPVPIGGGAESNPKKPMPWLIFLLAGVLLVFVAAGVGYALSIDSNDDSSTAPASQTSTPPSGDEPTATSAGGAESGTVSMPVDTSTPTPTETDTPLPPPTATTVAPPTATDTPSPMPSDTHTATVAPSNTPVAPTTTATRPSVTPIPPNVGPTDTPTPLVIGGTATPTASRPVLPTSTPRPPTATPRFTPTPIPIPATPTPAGELDGFESIAWGSSNANWGSLTSTTEQVHDGGGAAKLAYTFPGAEAGNSYVVLNRNIPIAGTPSQFTLWVYGNGSNHFLNIQVTDSAGQNYQFSFGRISHQGWQQMTAKVDPNLDWPNQRLPNKADNAPLPQYPIRVTGIVLDAHPDGQNVNGTIYLDDLRSN